MANWQMNDPLIGQQLGNYRLDSVVGRGGMATVYYGWDVNLHRPTAVKVIDARYRDNPTYAERFLQEARVVATWRHEHILQVYAAGQQDDLYYFAMEYVDGPDLSKVMKQYTDAGELMPHEDVLNIGRAVADALDYAHSQEIIHRDVKPSNVMVAKNGRIALADFGLALDARQGSLGGTFGTPHYIAPEQARNSETAVPQSDLYALGIILYEMLTGAVPFDDPSPTSLAMQHLTLPPPPPRQLNPNLNAATETVLLKALNKQPADRYQSGADLMTALADALKAEDTLAPSGNPRLPVEVADSAALPPLPVGVAIPALSQMSVVEQVSLYMPPPPPAVQTNPTPKPTTVAPEAAVLPQQRPSSSRPSLPPVTRPASPSRPAVPVSWLVIGGIAILLLLAAGRSFLSDDNETATAAPTSNQLSPPASPTSAAIASPAPTEVAALPVITDPTATNAATDTATSTALSASVATALSTDVATLTPIPPPADTAVPTQAPNTPVAQSPTATPTGLRLVMFYDGTSFYLHNPNRADIRVSPLVFEALDESGNLSGYWFEGSSWAQFYSLVKEFGCMRLELTKVTGYLRPSQCREYNASVTPEQNADNVFWTQRPGVAAFRVVWQGQEVGRCPVNVNQCEVYLP